jgi:hypothetical protein
MATISRIKRSGTAGNPPTLAQGELAYSSLAGTSANGGDRLYIGTGTETAGDAVNHVVIGGKFFTDKLDHVEGVVTANSALVVDAASKLDVLNVDNVTINGNTVSTTDVNGNLILAPNGTGKVVASGNAFPNTTGTADQYLKTDGAGTLSWSAIPSGSFTINGDSGTDVFTTGQTLTISGGTDLTSVVTDNNVTISADATLARRADVSYVGTTAVALNRASANQSLTGISSVVMPGATSGAITFTPAAVAGTNTITLPASSGTVALTNQTLAGFAATTSAQLASVISDETGTGALVFATSPTLVTPNIGAATATSVTGTGALSIAAGGTNTSVNLVPNGTGTVDVASKRITSVATPTAASDAANKAYVDSIQQGLDIKESVRFASTSALTVTATATTLTNAGAQAALIMDGVTAVVGDRVLIKDQAAAAQNGIYTVTNVGSVSTNWVLTRAADFDETAEVDSGAFTFIESGTTNSATGWVLTATGPVTIGTTVLTFTQFSGAGLINAGAGLTKTGNTLDVAVGNGIAIVSDSVQLASTVAGNGLTYTSGVLDVVGTTNRITVAADSIDIAATYAGQASITTTGTLTSGALGTGFTTVGVAQGGTGATTLTARGVVYGNGTSALAAVAASVNNSLLQADATGNPYWSNVIDGGTY